MLVFQTYNIKLICCLTVVLIAAEFAYAKPWKGIVPLQSNRVAAEKILGPPSMDNGGAVIYETADERVSIEYSKGPCSVELSQWNVPRNTVISIWITPKRAVNIADLQLDQSFVKLPDEHRQDVVHYVNLKDGIEYTASETGELGLIKYFPSAEDEKLRCKSAGCP